MAVAPVLLPDYASVDSKSNARIEPLLRAIGDCREVQPNVASSLLADAMGSRTTQGISKARRLVWDELKLEIGKLLAEEVSEPAGSNYIARLTDAMLTLQQLEARRVG